MRLSCIALVMMALVCATLVSGQTAVSELKAKADAGDARAQVALARAYEKGTGVSQNDELAAKWYLAAADQGSAEAQNSLGVLYRLGRGVIVDKPKAVELYRKAAMQGYGPAMFNLAAAYYNGDGIGTSDSYAYVWFSLAARAGSGEAKEAVARMETELTPSRLAGMKVMLAELLRKGDGVPANPAFAFEVVRKLEGNAAAEYQMGRMYAEGSGVAQNYPEAIRHLNASSRIEAQEYLASLYVDARGVPVDVAKAVAILDRVRSDNAAIRARIADVYFAGQGTERNYKRAFANYEIAANSGDAHALHIMGVSALDGLGTRKNAGDACTFFVVAANLGSREAVAELEKSCQGATLEKAKKSAAQWIGQRIAVKRALERHRSQSSAGR